MDGFDAVNIYFVKVHFSISLLFFHTECYYNRYETVSFNR